MTNVRPCALIENTHCKSFSRNISGLYTQGNHPKLGCPLGTYSWKVSYFFQFCKTIELGASEGVKMQVAANPSILTQKLKQGMFFHKKNEWN